MAEERNNPMDAYQAFIDELVERTPSLGARLVRESGKLTNAPAEADLNGLVARLDPADRELLAQALDRERGGAVHDVLVTLTWWLDTGRLSWAAGGVALPAGIEGGLNNDYVGRLAGWRWPPRAETPDHQDE